MRIFYTLAIGLPACLMLNAIGVALFCTILGIPLALTCFMAASKVLTLR